MDRIKLESKNTAVIYYIYSNGKIGRATSGKERSKYYPSDTFAVVIFDYDYATDDVLKLLDNAIPNILKTDGVSLDDIDVKNLTLDDAMYEEKRGLSLIPRIVIDSLCKPIDYDEKIGISGAAGIKDISRAFDLNNAESALQEAMKEAKGERMTPSS